MKRNHLLVGLALVLSLMIPAGCAAKQQAKQTPVVRIFDIMACNVYMDYDFLTRNKEQHKFVVSFYPSPGVVLPEVIDGITAYGPDGYKVDFKNEMFDKKTLNGYVHVKSMNSYYYAVYLTTGFMKEGEYTIEVKLKDGRTLKKSRVQNNASTRAAMNFYMKNRDKMRSAQSPSRNNPPQAISNIKFTRSTMKDLNGPDAYYVTYLYEADAPEKAQSVNVIWWDNIFIRKLGGDAQAGFNRSEVALPKELKPKTTYVYFVEVMDQNTQGDVNYTIFQPHQVFTTP